MTVVVPMEYRPATPVGARSACGTFDEVPTEHNYWLNEVEAAHREFGELAQNQLDPALSSEEHSEYWSQLMDLMADARMGVVQVRQGGTGMAIRGIIMELRPLLPAQRAPFGKRPRQLRLYYGEPETVPARLLPLRLATKAASDAGYIEQNADIELAICRAHEWQARTAGGQLALTSEGSGGDD